MSNSAYFEDLLYEAHQNGVFNELIEKVKEIKTEFPYLDRTEAYERALKLISDETEAKKK
jgi:hypothetical protein